MSPKKNKTSVLMRIIAKLDKLTLIKLGALMSFLFIIYLVLPIGGSKQDTIIRYQNREEYKINRFEDLNYSEIVKVASIENLAMIGTVNRYGVSGKTTQERLYGMILRSLRYQNISRTVEKKYALPKNLILAMVMQETGGVDLLPNSLDDGGFGLCHMQPLVASDFGLKTYKNCKDLVNQTHGKELREQILKHQNDPLALTQLDDRLNPVLNLDAVGRILAYHRDGVKRKRTRIQTAILGYAGSTNYDVYYENVRNYMEQLNDRFIIEEVRDEFNKRNPSLTINGQMANFNDYITYCQQLNRNYGLDVLLNE